MKAGRIRSRRGECGGTGADKKLTTIKVHHEGLLLAGVIEPAVIVNPPPVPLFVFQLAAAPAKNIAGDVPKGVAPATPRSTGAAPALMNFRRFAVADAIGGKADRDNATRTAVLYGVTPAWAENSLEPLSPGVDVAMTNDAPDAGNVAMLATVVRFIVPP